MAPLRTGASAASAVERRFDRCAWIIVMRQGSLGATCASGVMRACRWSIIIDHSSMCTWRVSSSDQIGPGPATISPEVPCPRGGNRPKAHVLKVRCWKPIGTLHSPSNRSAIRSHLTLKRRHAISTQGDTPSSQVRPPARPPCTVRSCAPPRRLAPTCAPPIRLAPNRALSTATALAHAAPRSAPLHLSRSAPQAPHLASSPPPTHTCEAALLSASPLTRALDTAAAACWQAPVRTDSSAHVRRCLRRNHL